MSWNWIGIYELRKREREMSPIWWHRRNFSASSCTDLSISFRIATYQFHSSLSAFLSFSHERARRKVFICIFYGSQHECLEKISRINVYSTDFFTSLSATISFQNTCGEHLRGWKLFLCVKSFIRACLISSKTWHFFLPSSDMFTHSLTCEALSWNWVLISFATAPWPQNEIFFFACYKILI
jgi:hypothetical protein